MRDSGRDTSPNAVLRDAAAPADAPAASRADAHADAPGAGTHAGTAPRDGGAPAPARKAPPGLLYGLRVVVVAHAAALVVAASLAGQAVQAGGGAMAESHVMAGMLSHLVAIVQVVIALLVWRPGRGAGWPALASVVLLAAEMAQHLTWESLGAHLPNGVVMFGLTTAVLVWAWSPGSARRR